MMFKPWARSSSDNEKLASLLLVGTYREQNLQLPIKI